MTGILSAHADLRLAVLQASRGLAPFLLTLWVVGRWARMVNGWVGGWGVDTLEELVHGLAAHGIEAAQWSRSPST